MLDKAKATNETNNLSTSQQSTRQLKQTCELINETSGGYCGGVPPLPIPNREVKPTCADGTAMQCGRVGSRLLSAGALRIQYSRGSFFMPALFPVTLYPYVFSMFFIVIGKINAIPFSKSSPFKFPSCALQEALFPFNPYCELSSSFHPFIKKRPPCPCCLSCQPHPITSHSDAESQVI